MITTLIILGIILCSLLIIMCLGFITRSIFLLIGTIKGWY